MMTPKEQHQKGIFQMTAKDVIAFRDNGYPGADHLQVGSWYFFRNVIGRTGVEGPFKTPEEAQQALEALVKWP